MQQKPFKLAASYFLRSIAKQGPKLAHAVIDAGAMEMLVQNLELMDPELREASMWNLDYIVRQNGELAQAVVDFQAVPSLVLCAQEPEIPLKRIAVCTLADICKHSKTVFTKYTHVTTIAGTNTN